MGRIVIEDLVDQTLEVVVVDDEQDAKGPVVQLVGRDVTREISQGVVEILRRDTLLSFFSPSPRPSFES